MDEKKLCNFRPDPNQKSWIKDIGWRNDSEVFRAAMWFLQQQPNPVAVIKDYLKAQIDEAIPPDFKKHVAQSSVSGKKKSQGRGGRSAG